jgi:hypothetical protein
VEHGECTIKSLGEVRVEHNLADLEADAIGLLVLTNFKLVFKPSSTRRGEDPLENPADAEMLSLARVQAYFMVTLGQLLSVDVRPVTEGSRVKHSCIDVFTKDGRKLSY